MVCLKGLIVVANYPRTFSAGDVIPLNVSVLETAEGLLLSRVNDEGFSANGGTHPWGTNNTGPDGDGAWQMADFPLTELVGGL